MSFKDPWILLLIPFVLAMVYFIQRRQRPASIRFSDKNLFFGVPAGWRVRFRETPFFLRLVILALFLSALAGPRSVLDQTTHNVKGIDIVLTIDASGSMAAEDFQEGGKRFNRLNIVKKVVEGFIDSRPYDRMGLVVFGTLAYTACPLTTDHLWLKENLKRIDLDSIDNRATAIGSGISSSLVRLKNSSAKSKIIILLTDGVNNSGETDPVQAARIAQSLGIKIYTVGAGTKGIVPMPVRDRSGREVKDAFGRTVYQQFLSDLDEETLKKVAEITAGRYFRAQDTESLKQVYQEIDQLEKVEIEKVGFREYRYFVNQVLLIALGLLIVEIVLSHTVFLKLP